MKRFWDKVDKSGACWVWTATRTRFGYGRFMLDRKVRAAHRLSYELTKGPIPAGLMVLHSCDNPPCVNPDHLSVGTSADNVHDCMRKGRVRRRPLRGQGHPAAKLTYHDVVDIRSLRAFGATQSTLAAAFGVSQANVSMICSGVTWGGWSPDGAVRT